MNEGRGGLSHAYPQVTLHPLGRPYSLPITYHEIKLVFTVDFLCTPLESELLSDFLVNLYLFSTLNIMSICC